MIEVKPRNWIVVVPLALPLFCKIKPLILPCKELVISAPPTPFIISPADNEVTELVTCFFSIVP